MPPVKCPPGLRVDAPRLGVLIADHAAAEVGACEPDYNLPLGFEHLNFEPHPTRRVAMVLSPHRGPVIPAETVFLLFGNG
jgi:hypothetical protein